MKREKFIPKTVIDEDVPAFMGALAQAAKDGKKEFEFGGKTYKVRLKKDVVDKITKNMKESEDIDDIISALTEATASDYAKLSDDDLLDLISIFKGVGRSAAKPVVAAIKREMQKRSLKEEAELEEANNRLVAHTPAAAQRLIKKLKNKFSGYKWDDMVKGNEIIYPNEPHIKRFIKKQPEVADMKESADLEEGRSVKIKTRTGSHKYDYDELLPEVQKIVIMSKAVAKKNRMDVAKKITKAIIAGKIKNADISSDLATLIGINQPYAGHAPRGVVKDQMKKLKLESTDLEEAIKVKTHRGMFSMKKGEESLRNWVDGIVIMSDAVKKNQRKTVAQNIVKAIESGKIKNADLTQDLGALIGIKSPKGMEAPANIVKAKLKDLGLSESTDLEEGSDYPLYHKTFTAASQAALDLVKKRGFEIDDDDWFNQVSTGPKKPGKGKTNRYIVKVTKKGKETKKRLAFQVYGMDSGKYELNAYVESTDLEEAVKFWTVTITKKAGKLFKGQTVDVKARNSAEAIKKGIKQMKGNPALVPGGSVDAVLGESRNMDFEKTNVLTYDEYDEVKNFKNFNKKDWKRNAIQKKYVRIKKIKESGDLEEAKAPFTTLEKDWLRIKGIDTPRANKTRERLIKKYNLKPLISAVRPGSIKLGPLNDLKAKMGNHTIAGLDADGELIFVTNNPVKIYYPSNTKKRPEGEEIMSESVSLETLRLRKVVELSLGESIENVDSFIAEANIELTMTPSSIQKAYKKYVIERKTA